MITITIKGIPKQTHLELKRRAAANRRSLNSEVIVALESLMGVTTRQAGNVRQVQKAVKKIATRK